MKKVIVLLYLVVAVLFSAQAQEEKLRIAVFDPTSSGTGIDEGTRMAVREMISSAFVNTGKYTIVERSLLEKIMKEQAFSNSGAVDDSQVSEIGKLAGANKVVLSIISLVGGRNMLSIKLVDVQTASVEKQKTSVVSTSELLNRIEPLTLELLDEKSTLIVQKQVTIPEEISTPKEQKQTVPEEILTPKEQRQATVSEEISTPKEQEYTDVLQTSLIESKLVAKGKKVLLNGSALKSYAIRNMMMDNPDALRLFNKGRSQYAGGGAFVGIGIGIICFGSLFMIASIANNYYLPMLVGIAICTPGVLSIVLGSSMKSKGRNNILTSVNYYNSNKYTSDVKLNFGVTQHGLGFVLSF